MKRWKYRLALLLCVLLVMPSLSVHAAVTVNRGSGSKNETDEAEEKEHSDLTTTITETTKDKVDTTVSTVTKEAIEPADIVFVIDSTGSMAPHIQNVASNVENFSAYLEEKGVDLRMAVVEYRDITCDGEDSTIVHTVEGTPWHQTTAELIETLKLIKSNVNGGGDMPETVVDALGYVADGESLKFRSVTHKFAIVLSDASYKEENTKGLTMESLIASLQEQSINTSVITDKKYFKNYEALVGESGKMADIRSKNFSEELYQLADEIFKVITEEKLDETITPVTSVEVSCKGNNTIRVGNSVKLSAVILPADADERKVSWIVEDEETAGLTISADTKTCTVTGKKPGKTVVTATTMDGGFTGQYNITVIKGKTEPEEDEEPGTAGELTKNDLRVTPASKTVAKGKKFTVKVTLKKGAVDPELTKEELEELLEENIDSITFRSKKSSVASVNEETGKVTAKKKGTAVITATVNLVNGESVTFKTKVRVK